MAIKSSLLLIVGVFCILLKPISNQIRLTQNAPAYSQGGITPCDRYICRSWNNTQDLLDLTMTGMSTNQGYCIVKIAQAASSVSGLNPQNNFYLTPCPFPKYTCTSYTPTTTTDQYVVGACTLNSNYDTTALAYNNKLWVGEWCLQNSDCATGLCDRQLQDTPPPPYVTNVTLPPTLARVNQQRTNKCFTRKLGDPCTKDVNGFLHHEQCDLGLRCAVNPKYLYQATQAGQPNLYNPYICRTSLGFNVPCDTSTSLNTTGLANQNVDNADSASWERCQFGTECLSVVSNSSGVQNKNFLCYPWFAQLEAAVFAMVSFGNGAYQSTNGNANGNWNNINMKTTYELVYNSVTFPGRMCRSYSSNPPSITTTTAENTQFTCIVGQQTNLTFGQTACTVDTNCYNQGSTSVLMYGAGTQLPVGSNHYCSCAFFNELGQGWCRGFIGDNLVQGANPAIRSSQTQDYYTFFGNARFQNCYAYEIWNLYAPSNKTDQTHMQICVPPYPTFYDPAKAALKGNCYNVINYPQQVLSDDSVQSVVNNIYNYMYLPSNRWQFAMPGVYQLRASQQTILTYLDGSCPRFMCQQILLDQYYYGGVGGTQYNLYDGLPAPKGACAYYSERSNVWSIQACRSPFDYCTMCTTQFNPIPITPPSAAQRSFCKGYALTVNNTDFSTNPDIYNTATVQASEKVKAWKCQRIDHVLKRIYDYCWDDADCLSGLCSADGLCYVLVAGQTCTSDSQCDKNLRCAFQNASDNSLTCQQAISAGGECDINSYSRCKVGSFCILVENQLFPTCVNMFSLPGRTTFVFIDNMLNDLNYAFYTFPSSYPSLSYSQFDVMCTSGMYSNTQQNSNKFVDYIGCVDFFKKTRGGWPKECTIPGANSLECQSLQSYTYNQYNYVTSQVVDGQCRCTNSALFQHTLGSSGNGQDWDRSVYNSLGIGYCQGFPGESDNSILIFQRTYERDFQDCYPYEILKNAPLPSDAQVAADIQSGLITNWNWQFMPQLFSYAAGLIPYEYGVCGYLKPIYYDPQPMKASPQCYSTIFQQRRVNRLDGTYYQLWNRCPKYVCQPTVDVNVCRQYDPVSDIVLLQQCQGSARCMFYNASMYLCNYNVTGGKVIGQYCYLDQECQSQVCGPRDAFGLPNMNLSGRACQVQQATQSCVAHENCAAGLRCVYIYPGFIPNTNTTAQNPQFAAYKVTMQCMNALANGATCNLTVPTQCKYGSMCIQLYNGTTGNTTLQCQNYYSLGQGARIMNPVLVSSQKLFNQLCASGFYNFDNLNAQAVSWTGTNDQWVQYGSSQAGCYNRTLQQGFPSQCKNDTICNSNTNVGGYCNCSYFNDNGNGFCNPFETDDQSFLISQQTYYNSTFNSCNPFDYLHQYGNSACQMPKFLHDNIYVASYYSLNRSSCYLSVFMGIADGTFHIQRAWQWNQSYNSNICPQYACSPLTNATCRIYSSNWNSTWILNPCTDPGNICTRYNSTLYVCVRADGKLKGVGEQCFNNEQCMSNLCNGVCYVNQVNMPCVDHVNCDQNLRCVFTNISFKEGLYQQKYCQTAFISGLICDPFSYDLCRYGTTCGLIYGQQVGICIPWFSLPGGTNVTILTNFSIYTEYGFHQSLQTLYSELCQSGIYDPVRGCLPQFEQTAGGFPKACVTNSDCSGLYYGLPGQCTCLNANEMGTGYCLGFDGEGNNKTQTYFNSYQRPFINCYPYEIDNYWGSNPNCYRINYTVYNSAPNQSVGGCYLQVGINPFNSINSPLGNYNTGQFAGLLLCSNILTLLLAIFAFFLNNK